MNIKFICLNLWQGGNLFDGILDFLKAEDADIVALQEVYNGVTPNLERKYRSLQVIQDKLNYPFTDFAPAFLDNRKEGKIEQGNAVLSKFPIIENNIEFFNEPYRKDYTEEEKNFPSCPRNLEYVVLDTPEGNLNIFNLQGVWDLDGDNYSERRQKMSDVIIKNIRGKENVILAGDTNARPTNEAIRRIGKYLSNIFAGELKTTFNMKRKDDQGYAQAVVDMIFVSPKIKVISKSCPNIDISDHLPLIANLQIK